jgi:tetratricopeptide (TPR) repeat protein
MNLGRLRKVLPKFCAMILTASLSLFASVVDLCLEYKSGWFIADDSAGGNRQPYVAPNKEGTASPPARADAGLDRDGTRKQSDEYSEQYNHDLASICFKRAYIWHELKDYDKSINEYQRAINLDPSDATSYHNLGLGWLKKKEFRKAIDAFNCTVALAPDYGTAYSNLGVCWLGLGDIEKAMAAYDLAVKIDPKNDYSFAGRGECYALKQDHDRAIADYDRALRLSPGRADVFLLRGQSWEKKRNYARAIADFEESLRRTSGDAHEYYHVAWLLATCPDEKYRDGMKAFGYAVKAGELTTWNDPQVLDTLAAAYAQAGDFRHAAEWEERAVSLLPDGPQKEQYSSQLELYIRLARGRAGLRWPRHG